MYLQVQSGKCVAEKNFLVFALYLSFFPKIIVGPIVRSRDFLPQIKRYVGLSRILGFDITANFNLPYIAENISEFWSRWHMSLSTWLKDYVYIPLGGSRKGEMRTYINLMTTMMVSGIWHGVGWTFFLWRALHGVWSCIHRFFMNHGSKLMNGKIELNGSCTGWSADFIKGTVRILRVMLTFLLVTLLWVMFRADDLHSAVRVFKSMFTVHSGISQPYSWSFFP